MSKSINNLPLGSTNVHNKNAFDKEITREKYRNFIKIANDAVLEGYARASQYINRNSLEFFNKRHEAETKLAMIIADFYSKVSSDFKTFDMIKKFSTYNMTYFLLDNKALICFKAMDKKGKINNALTDRYEDTLAGNDISLNKGVRAELAKRGIHHQPPIFYVGYQPIENGGISVKMVRYEDNEAAFMLNLSEYFIAKERLAKSKLEILKIKKIG